MKSNIFRIVLIILTILFSNFKVFSKCSRKAKVKYLQENSWSKEYYLDVTFLKGSELNNATNSFKYSIYSDYAVIFWSQGQASVIQLSTYLICGYEISCDCLSNTIIALKGEDQDGDIWNICLDEYCY